MFAFFVFEVVAFCLLCCVFFRFVCFLVVCFVRCLRFVLFFTRVFVVLRVGFALCCLLVVLCVALLFCWCMAAYGVVFEWLHKVCLLCLSVFVLCCLCCCCVVHCMCV